MGLKYAEDNWKRQWNQVGTCKTRALLSAFNPPQVQRAEGGSTEDYKKDKKTSSPTGFWVFILNLQQLWPRLDGALSYLYSKTGV